MTLQGIDKRCFLSSYILLCKQIMLVAMFYYLPIKSMKSKSRQGHFQEIPSGYEFFEEATSVQGYGSIIYS